MKYTKTQIKSVQSAIKGLGINPGPIDGIVGDRTIDAAQTMLDVFSGKLDLSPEIVETMQPSAPIKDKIAAFKIDPNWTPNVVVVKGVEYKKRGKFKGSGTPIGAVVHYTVSGKSAKSAIAVVKYLASKGLGCPVVDEKGIIYVPENYNWETDIAYHAGNSKWNSIVGCSNYMIGFEMCNWGSAGKEQGASSLAIVSKKTDNMFPGVYETFTAEQEEFLINVMAYLKRKYSTFKIENVVGHDECATPLGRKNDPGGSFSITMPMFRALLKKSI